MSVRTTVTLDDDIVDRVKRESRSRGASFRDTLNDLLRAALLHLDNRPRRRTLKIKPVHMGYRAGLNYDDIESLLEYGESQQHRRPSSTPICSRTRNADAPQQAAAARWLKELVESGEPVALPWVTVWAFVRICTNPRIWVNPIPARQAFDIIGDWLAQPGVVVLQPGPRHSELLERLVIEHGATGALVSDAVLAALAIENGARLASTDHDFRRFPQLRWINPLATE